MSKDIFSRFDSGQETRAVHYRAHWSPAQSLSRLILGG